MRRSTEYSTCSSFPRLSTQFSSCSTCSALHKYPHVPLSTHTRAGWSFGSQKYSVPCRSQPSAVGVQLVFTQAMMRVSMSRTRAFRSSSTDAFLLRNAASSFSAGFFALSLGL